uniref:Uncharacterized protein n=1 Tax=Panagrolaimus sp. PS1159 TaxID=55785 RepID=A0AC35G3N1_9BILA
RSFGLNQLSAAEIIAERENVLKLLAQTTKDKMGKGNYTVDPATRYPYLAKLDDLTRILETQIDSDNVQHKNHKLPKWSNVVERFEFDHKCGLLKFCQHALTSFKIKIYNFKPLSWSDGRALAGLVARFRKDLINFSEISKNNDSCFILNYVTTILEDEYGISKPSLSVFTNDANEDDFLRYIAKVVNHLRQDSGYLNHKISGTLKVPSSKLGSKRPRYDASQVQKGEGIKKRADLLNNLLKKDAGIVDDDVQISSTSKYNEETIKAFLKSVEEHKASIDEGTIKKNTVKNPAKNDKALTSDAMDSDTLRPPKSSQRENSNFNLTKNQKITEKTDSDTLRPAKNSRKDNPKTSSKTDSDTLQPPTKLTKKESLKLIDERLAAPAIYPSLPILPEKIIVDSIKDSPPPNPPPRTVSAKEDIFNPSKAVPPSPAPIPPPRFTSMKNGYFIFPESSSSSQKPSAPYCDESELPPPVFSRHTSLSEASKYSTIKDPWIEQIPTPEVTEEVKTTHPLATEDGSSKTAIKIPSETKTSINLLTKPPKVAERVYFTPAKAYRSNTLKLPASAKSQLFALLNNSSRFNTLPTNFNKESISFSDIKKYMNGETESSDDETDSETDSDEYELSTLCTDSESESLCYYENISSEPSSLHTNSEDSDPDENDATLKRNTLSSKKGGEIFNDNDYIAFLQSLPKE